MEHVREVFLHANPIYYSIHVGHINSIRLTATHVAVYSGLISLFLTSTALIGVRSMTKNPKALNPMPF